MKVLAVSGSYHSSLLNYFSQMGWGYLSCAYFTLASWGTQHVQFHRLTAGEELALESVTTWVPPVSKLDDAWRIYWTLGLILEQVQTFVAE